jgi:hypothetical protein
MIWIELPAIEANIGSEPVELNESLRAAVAVLAEAHERAEPRMRAQRLVEYHLSHIVGRPRDAPKNPGSGFT